MNIIKKSAKDLIESIFDLNGCGGIDATPADEVEIIEEPAPEEEQEPPKDTFEVTDSFPVRDQPVPAYSVNENGIEIVFTKSDVTAVPLDPFDPENIKTIKIYKNDVLDIEITYDENNFSFVNGVQWVGGEVNGTRVIIDLNAYGIVINDDTAYKVEVPKGFFVAKDDNNNDIFSESYNLTFQTQ